MPGHIDTQYEELLEHILTEGDTVPSRPGIDTREVFGPQLTYDLRNGFPLITTKKVFTRGIFAELLWLLSGSTSVRPLQEQDVHIWDEWADENGDLGPVYGHQWRHWEEDSFPAQGGIDQIADLIDAIKHDPHGRRHIVTAWNPTDVPFQALPPCHMMFQCHVDSTGRLSLKLYQRSADMFLGVPFNLASYAALTHLIAAHTGTTPYRFIWTAGSAHIYSNHIQAVETQLDRVAFPFPTFELTPRDSIFDHETGDLRVVGYKHHDALKGEVAV